MVLATQLTSPKKTTLKSRNNRKKQLLEDTGEWMEADILSLGGVCTEGRGVIKISVSGKNTLQEWGKLKIFSIKAYLENSTLADKHFKKSWRKFMSG